MNKRLLAALFVLTLVLIQSNNHISTNGNSVERDYWPTNGWIEASFSEVDLNKQKIDEMFNYIEDYDYDIDSVLIVKNGYLVVEEYPRTYDAENLHIVYSVTKSFVSTLIGIAIEEGYIEGVDKKVLDYFENATVPGLEFKENITIEHLLTMTSGIQWNEEDYSSPTNDFRQMTSSDNWVEYVLNKNMVAEPGTVFNYNSGGSHLLSAILQNATGVSSLVYLKDHILDPLGISSIFWEQDPQDIYFGGSHLYLRPQDMSKFGYLFLNNGTWNGTQIVPKEWVLNASNNTVSIDDWRSYGYQWWVYPQIESYLALGWAGQIIQIIPEHDIVAVFTSSLDSGWPFVILIVDYIIQAAEEGFVEETSFESVSIVFSLLLISGLVIHRRRKRLNSM